MAAGTDESCYIGYLRSSGGGRYEIWKTDNTLGFTFLAGVDAPPAELPIAAGTIITLEVEGTVLRLGSDASGAATE